VNDNIDAHGFFNLCFVYSLGGGSGGYAPFDFDLDEFSLDGSGDVG